MHRAFSKLVAEGGFEPQHPVGYEPKVTPGFPAAEMVDPRGVEPRLTGCKPVVFPSYSEPKSGRDTGTRTRTVWLRTKWPTFSLCPRRVVGDQGFEP